MRKTTLMKTVSAVVCVLLLVSAVLLLSRTRVESAPLDSPDDEFYQEEILQKNAVAANSLMEKTWGCDQVGKPRYPDSLSGFWIDGDQLVVGITDYTEETMEEYRNAAGSYSSCLRFVQMQYSYNYLYSEALIIGDFLREQGAPLSLYYVNQQNNSISIGLACDKEELAGWNALLNEEYGYVTVSVSVIPYYKLQTTFLKGADTIYNSSVMGWMSLSCCGTYIMAAMSF